MGMKIFTIFAVEARPRNNYLRNILLSHFICSGLTRAPPRHMLLDSRSQFTCNSSLSAAFQNLWYTLYPRMQQPLSQLSASTMIASLAFSYQIIAASGTCELQLMHTVYIFTVTVPLRKCNSQTIVVVHCSHATTRPRKFPVIRTVPLISLSAI